MIKTLGNVLYLMIASSSSLIYILIIYLISRLISLIPLSRKFKKKIFLRLCKFLFHVFISFFQFWFPREIFVKYNKKKALSKVKNIIISNHCTDFDWIFICKLALDWNIFQNLSIVMKESLARIPLLGYIIKNCGHLYLNRDKSKDIKIIDKFSKEMKAQQNYNILLFPEGTYTSEKSLASAKEFAKSEGIVIDGTPYRPRRVLIPRKLGFNIITDSLDQSYEGIMDITILTNPYMLRPCEECSFTDLFVTRKKVINEAFIIDYRNKSEITDDYLQNSFARKDEILEKYNKFYEGEFKNINQFKKFLKETNKIHDGDIVETIEMSSKYRVIIIAASLIFYLPLFFMARHLIKRLIKVKD